MSTRKFKGKRPRNVKFGAAQHHTVTATYWRLSKTTMEYLFRQLGEKGFFTEMVKRSNVSVSTVIYRSLVI